ncbi:MAG: hypothetical protein IH943_00270 [Acidobacteria bacterium]|jgi:hypothetical protein|nr:hypothetical protein [Acidobacteriota bacterium]MCZ6661713.1 hypothetical protein [Actinomycetota bacterium]
MRRALTFLVFAVVLVVAFALIGPSLPEGNPLRDAAEGLREIGNSMADNFGGGYGQLPAG